MKYIFVILVDQQMTNGLFDMRVDNEKLKSK